MKTKSLTILFVDDEKPIVELYKRVFCQFDHDVIGHHNGSSALEEFQADPHKFDLVITDHDMPVIKGTDLARKILEIRPNMPIVIHTGFKTDDLEEEAKAIGINKIVEKPLSVKAIPTLLSDVLYEGQC